MAGGYGFDRRSSERIGDVVRDVERQPRGSAEDGWPTMSRGGGSGIWFATNSGTSFTAGTNRSLNLYNRSGTTVVSSATVYNPSWAGTYAASARLIVAGIDGEWVVIGKFC